MPSDIHIRAYQPHDFPALHKLDQACFASGIAYSKNTLRYFLDLESSACLVAEIERDVAGFVVSEVDAPLAHIITLDVAERYRRNGVGSLLLAAAEERLAAQGVRSVLLETAVDNEAAIAFWQRHGYRTHGRLKRYYLGRIDAYEMQKTLPYPPERIDDR